MGCDGDGPYFSGVNMGTGTILDPIRLLAGQELVTLPPKRFHQLLC